MKTTKLIPGMFGAVVLASLYGEGCAEGFPEKTGYLIDSRGNVARNSYGECWRTGYWTPAMAIEECDPGLVKKEKPKQAEPLMPAPAPVVSSAPKPPATPEEPAMAALAKKEKPGEAEPLLPAPAPVAPPVVSSAPKPPAAPEKPAMAAAAAERPAVAVSFNAETLFDFDKAVVKPEGRKILDEKIVTGMQMHPEVALLVITGHADFIGTDEYNQNLSGRRANAVKAYLVKQGIAAERMRASGKGESEPNPEANTKQVCKGMRGKKLIACLQPDRRVTVVSQRGMPAR